MNTVSMRAFAFFTGKEESKLEPVKWSVNNTRYEVYAPSLASFDILDMLPHGLAVRNKVISTVGTVAHRGPSLYEVYPRSLSPVLLPMWEQVIQDANSNAAAVKKKPQRFLHINSDAATNIREAIIN
jgi:hypothetical protein